MANTPDILLGLQSSINTLSEQTGKLADAQASQLEKIQRIVRSLVVVLIFNFVLLAGVVSLAIWTKDTSDKTARGHADLVALIKVIDQSGPCPIYDVILDGYNPKSPTAKANPKVYEKQFSDYETVAKALGCPHTKRGPN
jgi:hypothetical protein